MKLLPFNVGGRKLMSPLDKLSWWWEFFMLYFDTLDFWFMLLHFVLRLLVQYMKQMFPWISSCLFPFSVLYVIWYLGKMISLVCHHVQIFCFPVTAFQTAPGVWIEALFHELMLIKEGVIYYGCFVIYDLQATSFKGRLFEYLFFFRLIKLQARTVEL